MSRVMQAMSSKRVVALGRRIKGPAQAHSEFRKALD